MKKSNEKSQMHKFIAAAREHECDESEESFDEKLKELAKAKPQQNSNQAKE